MLQSAQIQKRQSEIREALSGLAATEQPTDEQRSKMDALDTEYRGNESRYRAALVSEDTERREAGEKLETRDGTEWADLVGGYELRQVALQLDEGRPLDGATAEVVQEMRNAGGYRGVPVPLEALEQRAGETVSTGIPDPMHTAPIIDRLFPNSVASQMGTRMVNIPAGSNEFPIVTSNVSAGWASSETGDVAGPTQYTTSPFSLSPDSTLGVQLAVTRKAMKQSAGIEAAIRRDLQGAIAAELDKAIFLGTGATGQPSGVVSKASAYGITEFDASAASVDYSTFIDAVAQFIGNNTATGPAGVRALIRPEVWAYLEAAMFDTGSGITQYDKVAAKMGAIAMSNDALAAPATNVSKMLLTSNAGGLSPIFAGIWGGVDLIRDPYSKAHSGQLLVTGLVTCDVTVSRTSQLRLVKVKSA